MALQRVKKPAPISVSVLMSHRKTSEIGGHFEKCSKTLLLGY
jgi:hypothetical protein